MVKKPNRFTLHIKTEFATEKNLGQGKMLINLYNLWIELYLVQV